MPKSPPRKRVRRAKYTAEMKMLVRELYPLCRTIEDKEELANRLGMDSIHKLYNLASRLKVTRSYDDEETLCEGDIEDRPGRDRSRLKLRQQINETHFTSADNRYIREHFGSMRPDEIAFQRGHSETAILYRARQMRLRTFPRFWDLERVRAWLDLEDCTVEDLRSEGLVIFSLPDRRRKVQIVVVSTDSLAQWMISNNRARLLRRAGADEFFIQEVLETIEGGKKTGPQRESCTYLSAGHTCMNPFAGIGFGLFCAKTERHEAGEDPKCRVREVDVADLEAARHDPEGIPRIRRGVGRQLPVTGNP